MKPERALALGLYDYFAATTFGVAAASASWLLIPDAFGPILMMLAGMVVGLVAAFPLLGFFSYVMGGFEIIVMSMQIGMLAGMAGGMMIEESLGTAVTAGALVGLVVQCVLDVANRMLRGEVPHD